MRVLFLAENRLDKASYRYRVHQYLLDLREAGIECDVANPKSIPLTQIQRLRGYDVVVIQKSLLSVHWMLLASLAAPRIVFDLDDAVWTCINHKWGAYVRRRVENRFKCVCRKSSLVIAGNEYLAERSRRYARRAVIIPTCLDTDYYQPAAPRTDDGTVRIGWIGRGHNLAYMDMLEPAFERLRREVDARLVIISNERYESPNIPTEWVEWSIENEREALSSLDIGVMPLIEDDWTLGKCSFKILQYMACGVPSVASPVGMNADVAIDGQNGFLARNGEEWYDKLHVLAVDPVKRAEIAAHGRRTVEECFSSKVGARLLIQALRDLVG